MAVFMDLEDDAEPLEHHAYAHHPVKPEWTLWTHGRDTTSTPESQHLPAASGGPPVPSSNGSASDADIKMHNSDSSDASSVRSATSLTNTRSKVTDALGCYPVVMAIARCLDLNAIDNLSRTCRAVHDSLLEYRSSALTHTLHCVNEDLPIDRESTFRYRARAGNWYYMQDDAQMRAAPGADVAKSGSCARDMVAECRRCSTAICRNCAIKPPAPIVLKERHRRLCIPCTRAPLPLLVNPPLRADTPLSSDPLRTAVCRCETDGVWLCQPCGRSIRGSDNDYRSIWKWRNQYGEVLGGVGTGIGEGDRGVPCGRESKCCSSKEREQETDCDAEDGRAGSSHDIRLHHSNGSSYFGSSPLSSSSWSSTLAHRPGHTQSHAVSSPWAIPSTTSTTTTSALSPASAATPPYADSVDHRTPSPHFRPGYARHEVEGIGGVVKSVGVRLVRVGACVPEWEDEKHRGIVLGREVSGRSRSWCGWCWRVIPRNQDRVLEGQNARE
ncbi:uncharacterized protein B0I36DRAFT_330581 [Microdochium trichocladiopsis]|uniref:Uncharacterized protein n=1 Tax=Microdochium trichocladiopsis TaxID=1682393 RepID=A0A9P8XZ64_9PEZI|nr:uncharacterized protein B0I36DRAFT_330581 [Microdochium trichocladiopsis]KAH7026400.1 hypothetical protein B0I36DRAFT_330581 [Microdochium trichocladiopsis]